MNCHLVVPDLFHAAAGGAGLYGGLAVPALETLLARGTSSGRDGASLERWLAGTFRIAADPDLPLAALSLSGDGVDPGDACWLQADPVHLSIHRDQLLLTDQGRPLLTADEARELTGALSAHFAADGLAFLAPTPQRWYVRARHVPRIRTTPTAEAIGQRIEAVLPQGDDGPRWRRTINEAQMLLHAHPCNEAREERGEAPINSIWPWGAGRLPQLPRDAHYAAVWSSHPLATGIASAAGLTSQTVPPSAAPFLQAVSGNTADKPQLLVLDGLREALAGGPEAWRSTLGEMEARWFVPLIEGLRRGVLSSLTLHALGPAHGCTVTATRFDPLKFWRPKRTLSHYIPS